MTLAIYLDSNDYSRFSELHKQSDAIRRTFDTLTTWVSEGRIEVRYSSVNVLEAAPVTKDVTPLALARLNTIYRLCGRKCLIDVVRLLQVEATQAASAEVRSDIGDWHPAVYNLNIPDAASIARAMLEKARSAATPKEMRSFESRFFDRSGRFKDSARPKIVAFRRSIGAAPFTRYPLSPGALDTYYAFLLGRARRQQLTAVLIELHLEALVRRLARRARGRWMCDHDQREVARSKPPIVGHRIRQGTALGDGYAGRCRIGSNLAGKRGGIPGVSMVVEHLVPSSRGTEQWATADGADSCVLSRPRRGLP